MTPLSRLSLLALLAGVLAPATAQELDDGRQVHATPTGIRLLRGDGYGYRVFSHGPQGLRSAGFKWGGSLEALQPIPLPGGQHPGDWDGALPVVYQPASSGDANFSALVASVRGSQLHGHLVLRDCDPWSTPSVASRVDYYERSRSFVFPKVAFGAGFSFPQGSWVLGTDQPGHQAYLPRPPFPDQRRPATRVYGLQRWQATNAWMFADFGSPHPPGGNPDDRQLLLGRNATTIVGNRAYTAVAATDPHRPTGANFDLAILELDLATGSSSWSLLPPIQLHPGLNAALEAIRAPILVGWNDNGGVVLHLIVVALESSQLNDQRQRRWNVYHRMRRGNGPWIDGTEKQGPWIGTPPSTPPGGWQSPHPAGYPPGFSVTAVALRETPNPVEPGERRPVRIEVFGHSDDGRHALRAFYDPTHQPVLPPWLIWEPLLTWPNGERKFTTSALHTSPVVGSPGYVHAFYGDAGGSGKIDVWSRSDNATTATTWTMP